MARWSEGVTKEAKQCSTRIDLSCHLAVVAFGVAWVAAGASISTCRPSLVPGAGELAGFRGSARRSVARGAASVPASPFSGATWLGAEGPARSEV